MRRRQAGMAMIQRMMRVEVSVPMLVSFLVRCGGRVLGRLAVSSRLLV
jgi:hypothetical protein